MVTTSWVLEEKVWWKPLDMMKRPFPSTSETCNSNDNSVLNEEALSARSNVSNGDTSSVHVSDNSSVLSSDSSIDTSITETIVNGYSNEFPYDLEDFALLILGSGALYGYTGPGRPSPNVNYDWWDLAYLHEVEVRRDPERGDDEDERVPQLDLNLASA
jgi:hypothetical protein